jgi:hypothetical protein
MSVEELKAAIRAYADEQAEGWETVVVTAHDGTGLRHSLVVSPAGGAAKTPATRSEASAAAPVSRR